MNLQTLEDKLTELSSQCEKLALLLEAERKALQSWHLSEAGSLSMDKELLLESLRSADLEFRALTAASARTYGCEPSDLFEQEGLERLKVLRDRVRAANTQVRRQAERTEIATRHVLRFLERLRSAADLPQLSYAARLSSQARRATTFYH